MGRLRCGGVTLHYANYQTHARYLQLTSKTKVQNTGSKTVKINHSREHKHTLLPEKPSSSFFPHMKFIRIAAPVLTCFVCSAEVSAWGWRESESSLLRSSEATPASSERTASSGDDTDWVDIGKVSSQPDTPLNAEHGPSTVVQTSHIDDPFEVVPAVNRMAANTPPFPTAQDLERMEAERRERAAGEDIIKTLKDSGIDVPANTDPRKIWQELQETRQESEDYPGVMVGASYFRILYIKTCCVTYVY